MEHNHSLLTEMPNQEEFRNLIVDPADVCAQNSGGWEPSKKIRVHCTDKNTPEQPTDQGVEQQICPSEKVATTISNQENKKQLDEVESSDDECEIITFMIGATRMHDTSKPMPPPTRFVRKGYSTQ
jgi:hypothetical protein